MTSLNLVDDRGTRNDQATEFRPFLGIMKTTMKNYLKLFQNWTRDNRDQIFTMRYRRLLCVV